MDAHSGPMDALGGSLLGSLVGPWTIHGGSRVGP